MDTQRRTVRYTTEPQYARGAVGAVYAIAAMGVLALMFIGAPSNTAIEWLILVSTAALFTALLLIPQRVDLEDDGVRVVVGGFTLRCLPWESCGSVEATHVSLWTHGAGIRLSGGGRTGFIMSGGHGVTIHNTSGRGSTTISVGTESERDALLAELSARGSPHAGSRARSPSPVGDRPDPRRGEARPLHRGTASSRPRRREA